MPFDHSKSHPNPGVQVPNRPKGFFWWVGLIFMFLFALLFAVTVFLAGKVYNVMYRSEPDKIDMEAINTAAGDRNGIDTLKPRSALGQPSADTYVFVPEPPRSTGDDHGSNESRSGNDEMRPYIPAPEEAPTTGRSEPAPDAEPYDEGFRDGLGRLGGSWDPNGDESPYDPLF